MGTFPLWWLGLLAYWNTVMQHVDRNIKWHKKVLVGFSEVRINSQHSQEEDVCAWKTRCWVSRERPMNKHYIQTQLGLLTEKNLFPLMSHIEGSACRNINISVRKGPLSGVGLHHIIMHIPASSTTQTLQQSWCDSGEIGLNTLL